MNHKFLFFLCLTTSMGSLKCDENCDKFGTLLYEDLSCKPEIPEGRKCPQQYKCDDFQITKDSCVFRSRKLAIGDSIDDDLIYGACHISCNCLKQYRTNMAGFTCAILDCPEWLNSDIKRGCYRNYTLGKCCSTGQICEPFDDVARCKVGKDEYKEGEEFWPENTCLKCVCRKGFEGKFEAPFCERQNCAQQVRYSEELARSCAPVYIERKTLCCPDEWVCPSDTDVIKTVNPKADRGSGLTCKFGDHDVKLGEGLDTKVEHWGKQVEVTCECVLPPFLTCKEKREEASTD